MYTAQNVNVKKCLFNAFICVSVKMTTVYAMNFLYNIPIYIKGKKLFLNIISLS